MRPKTQKRLAGIVTGAMVAVAAIWGLSWVVQQDRAELMYQRFVDLCRPGERVFGAAAAHDGLIPVTRQPNARTEELWDPQTKSVFSTSLHGNKVSCGVVVDVVPFSQAQEAALVSAFRQTVQEKLTHFEIEDMAEKNSADLFLVAADRADPNSDAMLLVRWGHEEPPHDALLLTYNYLAEIPNDV